MTQEPIKVIMLSIQLNGQNEVAACWLLCVRKCGVTHKQKVTNSKK